MKLLKLDYHDSAEASKLKEEIIQEILNSSIFIVVHYNKGGDVTYERFYITACEAIASLEMTKLDIMNEHAP
jgi:hypothetical protein